MHSPNGSLDANGWLVDHDPLPVAVLHDAHGACGFDARSVYVETYWLAVLGPSSVLAARRLALWLEAEPDGFEISTAALASSLGLGAGMGRHAPIVRTLARLAEFGLAHVGEVYAVRVTFPPLSARQIARLPDHLVAAHAGERATPVVGR